VGIWAFGACGGDGDGAGGSSASDPVTACKEITQIMCDKIFKCFTAAELEPHKTTYGLNPEDCRIKLDADCIPDKKNCAAGKTFQPEMAQKCIDGIKTFNCNDLVDPNTPAPAACDQTCVVK
jgi:hypothetical protein